MLYGFETAPCVSSAALMKGQLLEEADRAFHQGDRERCIEAIAQLYSVFDDEQEAD